MPFGLSSDALAGLGGGVMGASLLGGSGLLGNIFGGGGYSGPGVAMLPGQQQMGQNLYDAMGGYMPAAQQYAGAMNPAYANQAFQSLFNNPYAGGMQSAAGQAAGMAGQFAPLASQAGMGMFDAGRQALAAGQQAYQTAYDPQGALRAQLENQVQQQSNLTASQYGLGGSPAGATTANQALTNFDINWQNQQLARQLQGQQALQSGIGAYGSAAQQGLGLGREGMGFQQAAGALPYETARAIAQGQFGAIGAEQAAMQGGMQPYQQNIANMMGYLGLGQGAQQQAFNQWLQQQQMQQQGIGGLMQLGGTLGAAALMSGGGAGAGLGGAGAGAGLGGVGSALIPGVAMMA